MYLVENKGDTQMPKLPENKYYQKMVLLMQPTKLYLYYIYFKYYKEQKNTTMSCYP